MLLKTKNLEKFTHVFLVQLDKDSQRRLQTIPYSEPQKGENR